MLERNQELIKKATSSDFSYVMSMTGLTRYDIYNYKTGRSSRNILTIENHLIASIKNREKLIKKHNQRISKMLSAEDKKTNFVDVKSKLSNKKLAR